MMYLERIKKWFTSPTVDPVFPDKPSREYWMVTGYEPYTWTDYDIEQAELNGWTDIVVQEEDEYPYLKGTVHGIDPEYHFSFYVPKYHY